MEQKLSTLSPGQSGIITSTAAGKQSLSVRADPLSDASVTLADRLRDLGFTPGSRVALAVKSPLGDPLAFRIRGTLIALRRKDAALVTVLPDVPTADTAAGPAADTKEGRETV